MESERCNSHCCDHHQIEPKRDGEEEEENSRIDRYDFTRPGYVVSDDHADEAAEVNNASGQIEDAIKILIPCAVVIHGLNGFVRGVDILTSFNVSVYSFDMLQATV